MRKQYFREVVVLLGLGLLVVILLRPIETKAGVFDASQEVTYKEYWVPHSEFTAGCFENEAPYGSWYLEPWGCEKLLTFQIPDDFSNALKAEIYLDLWRNHDGKLARFSLNSGQLHKPNVGSDWSRTPYTGEIDLNELRKGSNTILFGEGGYHVHDIAIRIYYDDVHPLVGGPGSDVTPPDGNLLTIKGDGSEKDAGAGGNLQVNNNQITLKANVSNGAKYVEFHSYYFGFDEDNDGQLRDWHSRGHNNWFPGGIDEKPNGGTIDHAGTKATPSDGEYSVNWDISHIPDQGGMRFKIRVVDNAGNVREAAGGVSAVFSIGRSKPLIAFWAPDFDDAGLWMEGSKPPIINRKFKLPVDFSTSDYETGKLIHSFWNSTIIHLNWDEQNIWPNFAGPDHWHMSIANFNKELLWPGLNVIEYEYNNPGDFRPGAFAEKPGPMFILRRQAWAVDNKAPSMFDLVPAPNNTEVSAGTKIQAQILDDQTGIDYSTIKMMVQGVIVSPSITGANHSAMLVYRPSVGFEPHEEVVVNIEACDLGGKCFSETFSFEIEGENIPTDIVSDDFNSCALNEVVWEFRDSKGDSSYSVNGSEINISVPAGSNHDLWKGANHAPRIMQTANDADFRLKARFNSEMDQNLQMQGLLIAEDDQNFLRIGMRHDGTDGYLEAYAFEDGEPLTKLHLKLAEPIPSTIIVERFGNSWKYLYLNENDEWINARNFDHAMDVIEVGAFAGNYGSPASTAPAFTGKIDFFFDDNDPIDPQDPNPLYLPLEVIGEGAVEKTPLCGNPVTLTADPANGYFFDGWTSATGAISGRTNPLSTSFTAGEILTATFRIDALTLDVDVVNIGAGAGGSVTISPDKSVYNFGDEVTLIPSSPPPGWDFKGWSGDVDPADQNDDPLLITMDDDLDIVATFEAQPVTLAVDIDGQGSVVFDPDNDGSYRYGDLVKLTAVPEEEWGFDYWDGIDSGSSRDNPLDLVITEDMEFTAVFAERPPYVFFPVILAP